MESRSWRSGREHSCSRGGRGSERPVPCGRDVVAVGRSRCEHMGRRRPTTRPRVRRRPRVDRPLWTFLLILGAPFSLGLVLAVPALVTITLDRRRPCSQTLVPRGGRVEGGSALVVTAVGIAAAGVLLEALLPGGTAVRALLVRRLVVLDAEGEGHLLLRRPRRAVLHAASGRVLSGARSHARRRRLPRHRERRTSSRSHFQYWLFASGFVWALAGLLAERVPPWILWPFVLLLLARSAHRASVPDHRGRSVPRLPLRARSRARRALDRRLGTMEARRRDGAPLRGGQLTKREGLLLASVLIFAAARDHCAAVARAVAGHRDGRPGRRGRRRAVARLVRLPRRRGGVRVARPDPGGRARPSVAVR